LISKSLFLVF